MRRNPNKHAHPDLRDAVDVTRFWSLVDRRGPDECWPWAGDKDGDYGVFYFHRRLERAPSLALSFTTGEKRGEDLDTCHSCDNPPCCNPRHRRFDSRLSNVREMRERGRASRSGRLTDAEVIEIRERRASGARQKDLAENYGITDGQVSMIVRVIRWPNVGGPIQTERTYRHGE